MLDLLIRDGPIVDGTGAPARRGDVGVTRRRIVAVGEVDDSADENGRRRRPGGRARLRRPAHALRRAAALGPDGEPVAAARRHHGVRRQLRLHARARGADEHVDYLTRMMARVEGIPLAALRAGLPWDWKTFADWISNGSTARHRGQRRLPRPATRRCGAS